MSRTRIAIVLLLPLILAAAVLAWFAYGTRTPSLPQPEPDAGRVELAGTRVAASALEDPDEARRAFGFDIRGAGLLPVKVVIENRGTHAARLNPPQTFLIDGQGLAWPLLTADQARGRLAETLGEGKKPKLEPGARQWIEAAPILTGFALDVFIQGEPGAAASVRSDWLGRLLGEERESPEQRSRRDLLSRFLSNPPLPAGNTAVAWLFFPGRDEVRGAETLRLAVEAEGRVQLARIPLAPAAASADQPRAIAR